MNVQVADVMTETAQPPTRPPHALWRVVRRVMPYWIVLSTLGTIALWVWRQHFETYHLETVQEGVLYRDGCQSPREFENAVERTKVKTVVSLVDEREVADPAKPQFKWEEQVLAEKGVRLVRIPVKLGGWPTERDVKQFLDVVNDERNQPVLVHCAQGVRRTGMMAAAYQQAVMGYDDQKAKDAIVTFGHSERTIKDVKAFIDGYDPATGAVPAGSEGKE